MPAYAVERYGAGWTEPEKIVSCGPYLLSSWNKESSLVLDRNPHYYGTHSGNVTRIQFRFIDPVAEILAAYEANELDIVDIPDEMHAAVYRFMADYVS